MLQLNTRNGTMKLDLINIFSHPYGSNETRYKPGPIRESVFNGDEVSNLRFGTLQARLFLRLHPFFINAFVYLDSQAYTFLTELIHYSNHILASD